MVTSDRYGYFMDFLAYLNATLYLVTVTDQNDMFTGILGKSVGS